VVLAGGVEVDLILHELGYCGGSLLLPLLILLRGLSWRLLLLLIAYIFLNL
jgi:hypothetical protein